MFYTPNPRKTPVLQLAPMIDVVFLLLIFFMVATSFPDDTGVEIEKPDASTAAALPRDNLLFAVTQDEKYYTSGKQISAAEARHLIASAVMGRPEIAIIVQIDRRASSGALVTFLDLAREAGAQNLSIAAEKNGT